MNDFYWKAEIKIAESLYILWTTGFPFLFFFILVVNTGSSIVLPTHASGIQFLGEWQREGKKKPEKRGFFSHSLLATFLSFVARNIRLGLGLAPVHIQNYEILLQLWAPLPRPSSPAPFPGSLSKKTDILSDFWLPPPCTVPWLSHNSCQSQKLKEEINLRKINSVSLAFLTLNHLFNLPATVYFSEHSGSCFCVLSGVFSCNQ